MLNECSTLLLNLTPIIIIFLKFIQEKKPAKFQLFVIFYEKIPKFFKKYIEVRKYSLCTFLFVQYTILKYSIIFIQFIK